MKIRRVEVPLRGGVAIVERLSVRQMISLLDRLHVRRRNNLVADLDAASVESADRLSALAVLDKDRGLLSALLRHGFTIEGSIEIIGEGLKGDIEFEPASCKPSGEIVDSLIDEPTELMNTALALIGVDTLVESPDPPAGNAGSGSRKKSSGRSGSKTRR